MLFAWKANSCNLMIALMHQKEANKNGRISMVILLICGGAILTIMGSWGAGNPFLFQRGIFIYNKV